MGSGCKYCRNIGFVAQGGGASHRNVTAPTGCQDDTVMSGLGLDASTARKNRDSETLICMSK